MFCETFDGGTPAPMFMVRRGPYKYIACPIHPPLLFDLTADPLELTNLSGSSRLCRIEEDLAARANDRWDAGDVHRRVVASQRTRGLLKRVLSQGKRTSWDFTPAPDTFCGYRGELDDYYGWFGNRI